MCGLMSSTGVPSIASSPLTCSTVCRVLRHEGTTLHVAELDAIDGTPVLDLKPFMREFGPRGEVRQPEWATELMARYY